MAQQTIAIGISDGHAAEAVAHDVGDAVVLRQPLIDKGVIGGEKFRHGAVFAHHVIEEQLGFAAHGIGERAVEIGEEEEIGIDAIQVLQVQPFDGEVARQGSERWSASMRLTCFSSVMGSCNLFSAASAMSCSSGGLLHKKNERREASSRSVMR